MFGKKPKTKRILFVEDDEIVLMVYSRTKIKHREHIKVTIAESGEDAIKAIDESKYDFDLIILDLMMPKITGFDILKHLKQSKKHNNAYICILSSMSDEETVDRVMKMGAHQFVAKSRFSPDFVKTLLEKGEIIDNNWAV